MAQETLNGVKQFFGPRTRGEAKYGVNRTAGAEKELVIVFDGANYTYVTGTLPAGAIVTGPAVVEISEVFALGGTTPVINIGVSTTEGTNRLAQVSEAQAEALGTYSIASAGTLALNTPLAAAVTIKVALGGTTPTITGAGLLKLVVPYVVV